MPYTLAHPGFSIWIKRNWLKNLSYNGLMFGSITPDFDILFRFTESRFHIIGFNFIAIFVILVPLTIILSLIFHHFSRNTLIDYLPNTISKKLQYTKHFNYYRFLKENYTIELTSILIGIVFHFFLDYISHWDAYYFMFVVFKALFFIGLSPSYYFAEFTFYFGWYFPQVIATALGAYLIYKYWIENQFTLKHLFQEIIKMPAKKIIFWLIFSILAFLFVVLKFVLFNYEGNGYAWHSLVIYLTGGLVLSFFTTPILFHQILKFKKISLINNHIIHGLWIGNSLSNVELLTIQSFLDHGHSFQLWTYAIDLNIPRGTILKDANKIIDEKDVFSYHNTNQFGHGKGSYAGFSDLFRYKLLYERGGIWVDMDVTCLKPFDFPEPYLFRAHHKNGLVGNIMKCPKNSDLMLYCYNQAVDQINANNKDWMLPLKILKAGIEQYNLTPYIKNISNKDSWPVVSKLLVHQKVLNKEWYAIHWMNEEWRRLNISKESFLKESTIGDLLNKHKITYSEINKGKYRYTFKFNRLNYSLINLPFQIKGIFKQLFS
ncbi:MAG: DUF4184 family protein [Chitinophagales bacterium]